MKAAVLRGGEVTVRETADPVPGNGEVLVRTLACGICASDLHFMDNPDADADDDTGLSRYDANADIVMGHEYCVEVVEYGPNCQEKFPIGSRISSIPALLKPDGVRVIGQAADAPGGFGEYFVITEGLAVPVETDLPSEYVSVADAIAVGWSYTSRAAISTKEVPLVIGLGAIGLSAVASLKRMGIGPIVAADFVASRRELARKMGADVVVDPAEISPYAAWREIAFGSPEPIRDIMGVLDLKKCVIFECVGIPGVLDQIIKGCEPGTRIYSAGGAPEGDHLHTMTAKRKGLNFQFGGGPSVTHWNEAFDEVTSGRLDVAPMVGRVIGLDGVPSALNDARDANGPARIIVVPGR